MFPKPEVKRWRRVVHKELDRMGVRSDENNLRAAGLVLMAVSGFGTDTSVLSEVTGQPKQVVRSVLARLRKQRILVGQTLRVAWCGSNEFAAYVAVVCDVLVAEGSVSRAVDRKRSASLTGKTGGSRKPYRKRVKPALGAVWTPKLTKSNPLYAISDKGRAEWQEKGR